MEILEKYQGTITHDEFERLLRDVYANHGISDEFIRLERDFACILMDKDAQTWFTLRFAKRGQTRRPAARTWRTAQSLPRQKRAGVLSGLKIALDPGHIGGEWAKMEERWFKVGDAPPVQEGDMTLLVAKMLAPKTSGPRRASFVRARQSRTGDAISAG